MELSVCDDGYAATITEYVRICMYNETYKSPRRRC